MSAGPVKKTAQTAPAAAHQGRPLALDMACIDEDPQQPRRADNPGFSTESLDELAAAIRLRGVKTPISVREHPAVPGRFLVNHGARRVRAARRAGLQSIPGFIDNDYQAADQVVENLQRNALTAREIADFIGRELAKGSTKGGIARAISKSPAFVTQHVTLLDLPDPIAAAFNAGRVRDVTLVNGLVSAFRVAPGAVVAWLEDRHQEITRGSVKLLRAFLEDRDRLTPGDSEEGKDDGNGDGAGAAGTGGDLRRTAKAYRNRAGRAVLNHAVIVVQYGSRRARLLLQRAPSAEGRAWLQYDDESEVDVALAEVQLMAVRVG